MEKDTKDLLIVGGLVVAAYFFWKSKQNNGMAQNYTIYPMPFFFGGRGHGGGGHHKNADGSSPLDYPNICMQLQAAMDGCWADKQTIWTIMGSLNADQYKQLESEFGIRIIKGCLIMPNFTGSLKECMYEALSDSELNDFNTQIGNSIGAAIPLDDESQASDF